jgi:outer membrane protein assembly factor BamB
MDVSGWRLSTYDRANGTEMWSVPLPAEPLYNGIAIASDGTVIATLRDGRIVAVR